MGGHGHGRAGSAGLACLQGEGAVVLMWLAELDWLGWVGWWGMILGSTNEKRRVRGHVFFSVSESGAYQAALIPR